MNYSHLLKCGLNCPSRWERKNTVVLHVEPIARRNRRGRLSECWWWWCVSISEAWLRWHHTTRACSKHQLLTCKESWLQ